MITLAVCDKHRFLAGVNMQPLLICTPTHASVTKIQMYNLYMHEKEKAMWVIPFRAASLENVHRW